MTLGVKLDFLGKVDSTMALLNSPFTSDIVNLSCPVAPRACKWTAWLNRALEAIPQGLMGSKLATQVALLVRTGATSSRWLTLLGLPDIIRCLTQISILATFTPFLSKPLTFSAH